MGAEGPCTVMFLVWRVEAKVEALCGIESAPSEQEQQIRHQIRISTRRHGRTESPRASNIFENQATVKNI